MGLTDLKYFSNKKKPGKTKAFFICLVIASFLWLVHSLNTVYNYTIKVPVTFRNLPPNKNAVSEIPTSLFVQLKASGLKLCLILMNRPFAPVEVDFNNLKPVNRNQSYVLSSSDIDFEKSFKFETQIKHISPDTIYFAEKTGFQKIVPIKALVSVRCKPGYSFNAPQIDPAFVTIWGDTALIAKIDTVYTQPLNLSDVEKSIQCALPLIKPDPGVYSPFTETRVKISVARLVEQTLILPVNPLFRQNNRQVNIYPAKVKIRFTCLQNSFNPKDSSLFRALVNSDKINPVTKKSPVFLSATPADITVMSVEPAEVEVLILNNK